jgi:hypothetical protein
MRIFRNQKKKWLLGKKTEQRIYNIEKAKRRRENIYKISVSAAKLGIPIPGTAKDCTGITLKISDQDR